MKSNDENKLSMLRTVSGVCDKASAVMNTVPALWTNYQNFKVHIELIEDMVQNQIKPIDGITLDKTKARKKLINYVMTASGMLRAFADDNENMTLAQEVKVTRSMLMRMRDEVMYDASKIVIDAAENIQAQMGPYGLTPALLANMRAALDLYHNLIEATTEARTNRKYYTKQLSILIAEAMHMLRNNIDGHMEVIGLTHPDIVGKYRNSRAIYDYSGGRRKRVEDDMEKGMISGSVADGDGLPIVDALVKLDGTSMSCMTDEEGEFMIDNIPAGSYNLVVVMDGYKEKWENGLVISGGEEVSRDFVMETEET